MIKNSKPECTWKNKLLLGEGTLWVSSLSSLFFVDIKKKKILIFNNKTKKKRVLSTDKEIGFISYINKKKFILGLKSEIRIVNLINLKTICSIKVESDKPNNRINDGKTDPVGRLWFGTLDNFGKRNSGCLYCLDNNLKLHKVDKNYYTANGPAFLDKKNFYHTDSRKKIIYKIKINKNLKIIKKKIFLKFSGSDGSPDGMTVDKKNNLWVCHYNGAKISVYDLRGNKVHQIFIPAKNVTNCTFGGYQNSELFVSTALKGMNQKEIKKYPFSGSLFKTKTNIKGKKTIPFKKFGKQLD